MAFNLLSFQCQREQKLLGISSSPDVRSGGDLDGRSGSLSLTADRLVLCRKVEEKGVRGGGGSSSFLIKKFNLGFM